MTRPEPTITIVTVVWNNLDGLKTTCASIAAQTYRKIEHVVIDGGSTDGTPEWLESYAADHPIVAVSEADNGLYDAMNKGINKASGDLVLFLNGADVFTSDDDLEFVAREWVVGDWQWGYGGLRYVDEKGVALRGIVHSPFGLRKFQMGFMSVPHPACYVALPVLREFGGFRLDYGVSGDQELLMRIASKYRPAVWIRFVADFLVGGVHSSGSDFATELRWHKIRKDNGFNVGRYGAVDWAYAVARGSYRQGRVVAGRLVKRVGRA